MCKERANICKNTASWDKLDNAMNSLSPVQRAVTRCRRDTHAIGARPKKMIQPVVERASALPFQSESQYAANSMPPCLEMDR